MASLTDLMTFSLGLASSPEDLVASTFFLADPWSSLLELIASLVNCSSSSIGIVYMPKERELR